MVTTIIFDMDGVLLDSEPVWREIECEYYLKNYSLSLEFTDFDAFTGMPLRVFLRKLHERHQLPVDSLSQIHDVIVERVAQRIRQQPRPIAGIFDLLRYLQLNDIAMAVASSSPTSQINNVLKTLDIRHYFSAVVSAEGLSHGKPHPEIFLTAATMMEKPPESCLVIEDSLNGVIAAKAAGMRAIALPAEHQRSDVRFTIADNVVADHYQILALLAQ